MKSFNLDTELTDEQMTVFEPALQAARDMSEWEGSVYSFTDIQLETGFVRGVAVLHPIEAGLIMAVINPRKLLKEHKAGHFSLGEIKLIRQQLQAIAR